MIIKYNYRIPKDKLNCTSGVSNGSVKDKDELYPGNENGTNITTGKK